MLPILSIIIPCYNSGRYLNEALKSFEDYSDKSVYEAIIVNDGSTDSHTILKLAELESEGYIIIHQENRGPAAARNTGVKSANGKYILFLDSDNKIRSCCINKCIEILENDNKVGVVYGDPHFFGDTTEPRFAPQEFNMKTLLIKNYIDICSMIKREVWEDIGGFDEERILIGIEDWDFWVRVGAAGWEFYYINEIMYDYRIRYDSLIVSNKHKAKARNGYFYSKHANLLLENYKDLYYESKIYKSDRNRPFRSFIKYAYYKYLINN